MRAQLSFVALLAVLACDRDASTTAPAPVPAAAPEPAPPPEADPERMRSHVAFLADDALEGRAPGTEGDQRTREYVARALEEAGLDPAFVDGYVQTFGVTNGVRVRDGAKTMLEVSGKPVAHAVVPFSSDTGNDGSVTARAVFVGHGIAPGGKGTGDYEGQEERVQGSIVVALGGAPDDPHIPPAALRPQSRLIAARDHGAVGFVLWEPESATDYPNHGRADDLGLPALFVGREGTPSVLAALGKKAVTDLKVGARTRKAVTLATPVERVEIETANVAGRLPGNGKTEGILVLGAHMDHLGWGTSSSLAPGERAIHNGADDNASGVSAVLELARALAGRPVEERPQDLLFVTFGAEEMGLLGSKHFVESLDAGAREDITAMLNFDMVGRLKEDGLLVSGVGTSSVWPDLLEAQRGDLVLRTTPDGYGPSDHSSFYEVQIPVLHFFTGPHEDYHKPTDDLERIDFDGAVRVVAFAGRVVDALLDDAVEPDYLKVDRPKPRSTGFKVSLGTIPDYGADVDGVRLSGVRGGGAAERAGLAQGDVIKKLGEREVHNLDDYMAVFASMEPGKKYPVVVERDGKVLELEIEPDAPKKQH